MSESMWLPERFEEQRSHLRGVAYRILGSASEADDAVQEAWLRVSRAGTDGVENLTAWLTTVVARVCLNMLRTRERRREEPLDGGAAGAEPRVAAEAAAAVGGGAAVRSADPEQEAMLADSVGLALLVVLDTLTPAERMAFVLHDMFAVPFDEIGPMIDRSPEAARQLASRARRRVKGGSARHDADLARQRRVVDAYLAAARDGDFDALVEVLDPDIVLRADEGAGPTPEPVVIRGARTVAQGATSAAARVRFTEPALIDGRVGLVMAPGGHLALVITFTVDPVSERITRIDVISDEERLAGLEIAVLDA